MRGSYILQNISILCPAETLTLQRMMATLQCSVRYHHVMEWRYGATYSLPEHYGRFNHIENFADVGKAGGCLYPSTELRFKERQISCACMESNLDCPVV